MKVILLNHIDKIGRKGEVVTVKSGFARNYLLPRNLAIYATPQNMKRLSAIQNQAAEEEEKLIAELKKLDEKIRNISMVFISKVDEHDSMFGSVSETDIVNELAAKDIAVHKSMVLLDKHIKSLGESIVQIRLHKDVLSELKVLVEREAKEVSSELPEEALAETADTNSAEEVVPLEDLPAEQEPESEEANLYEDEK